MNSQEFLYRFNILYNNVSSNGAPGVNTYEVSALLTKALNELVKNYFLPQSNLKQTGFDDTAKRQLDFSNIIRVAQYNLLELPSLNDYDPRAINIPLDADLDNHGMLANKIFLILNEEVLLGHYEDTTFITDEIRQVKPLSIEEYQRLMSKPYKEPLKHQAWRLITRMKDGIRRADLIIRTADSTTYSGESKGIFYKIRYIKKPKPIVIDNFVTTYGENVSIDGVTGNEAGYDFNNPCELDDSIHEEILLRAVELAKVAWAGDLNETQLTMTAGQRSE